MGLFDRLKKEKNNSRRNMIYPIPTHLQEILIPVGNENSEFEVTGKIKCPCGSESFKILESNDKEITKAVCEKCNKEFLLFDSGKHGWNGFICGDDYLDREMPFNQYFCSECEKDTFGINIKISSQGKEDFEEECLSDDDSFTLADWVNAFDWITISLLCEECGFNSEEWLDFETM